MKKVWIRWPLSVAALHLAAWVLVCMALWVGGLAGDGWVLPGLGLVETALAYGLVYWSTYRGDHGQR